MFRKLALGSLAALALLFTAFAVRTAGYRAEQPAVEPAPALELGDDAVARLAGAIRFRTISHQDSALFPAAEFEAFRGYLERSFPRVHEALERELVGGHSVLYRWQGSDPGLAPVLLMGHQDVVPVEAGTEDAWTHGAFSGDVAGGYVWGRGAMDDKVNVLAILETVERMLGEGFRPRRTVYLAFGHDEEVGGFGGAARVAALLEARGVRLEYVLDEGGVIADGIVAGVAAPVALVGVAEKGVVSVELAVETEGGHSSRPPRETSIGILARAVSRVERNPMPARLTGATRAFLDAVGPAMTGARRAAMANLWALSPLVTRLLAGDPTTGAMVRTTTAPTIFEAGTKENVLASRARAVVNFRILPGDSVAGVVEHVRRTVDDPRVTVRAMALRSEPSPVTRTDTDAFGALAASIRAVAPGAVVAPYLVIGATDSRHFAPLTDNVFRFVPMIATPDALERMHGTDERIAVEDYARAVRFYRRLLRSTAGE